VDERVPVVGDDELAPAVADRAELHLRRHRLRARTAAALAVAALAASGCGSDDDGGSGAELGIPVPWARAEAGSGKELKVGYEADPCTRARRARVEETASRVVVTLGDPERDPKKACIGVVKRRCALVSLDEPLGARNAVDGAPGPRRRNRRVPIEQFGTCHAVPKTG
jgi:hypothetical protein